MILKIPVEIQKDLIDDDYGIGVDRIYFDKLLHIIKHEPDRYKLNSIYVSTEKSAEYNEPIIFVECYKVSNELVQIKQYYSLSDI